MFSSAVRVTVFGGREGCCPGILGPSRLRFAQLQSAVTPDDAYYCRTYYKAASARGGGAEEDSGFGGVFLCFTITDASCIGYRGFPHGSPHVHTYVHTYIYMHASHLYTYVSNTAPHPAVPRTVPRFFAAAVLCGTRQSFALDYGSPRLLRSTFPLCFCRSSSRNDESLSRSARSCGVKRKD
jgi:hypothetical protein